MDTAFYHGQGRRCGLIEGRGRAGQYVLGEEEALSDEAAGNQGIGPLETEAFARGYREGYVAAAEGSG